MILKKKILYDLFRLTRIVLIPLIPLYLLLFKINQKVKRPLNPGIPVICAGNITTGGTGKTPAVIFIVKLLKELGYSPAVVSRGYGGLKSKIGAIVTDGKKISLSPEEAGDESYLMALNLNGVPIAVGKNRLQSIEHLKQTFNIDIIVMDDGFQNFSIKKDISVVVIDAVRPFGNGLLLPAGDLRETKTSLSRSDIILLNKSDLVTEHELISLRKKISKIAPAVPIINSYYKIDSICRINNISHKEKIDSITGKKVLAISAIGNPDAFFMMIKKYNPGLLESIIFPDHCWFKKSDISRFINYSESCDYVITTEKDYIKLMEFDLNDRFFFLKIGMDISDNDVFRNYFI